MRTVLAMAGSCVALLGACGADSAATPDGPRIVVTTSILGDVVEQLVGDDASVEVVMPRGADPHGFALSAKHAAAMRDADVVVRNGLGLEAGLDDAVEAAADDGAMVLTATEYVETLPFDADGDGDLAADGHTDGLDDHDETEDGAAVDDSAADGDSDVDEEPQKAMPATEPDHAHHDHSGDDPHLFTDPVRMAEVARGLADDLARHIAALRAPAAQDRADAYVERLTALDHEIEEILAIVPHERRLLVTNHEVFGYFARRYGFELLGAVVPGGSTLAEPSASALAELADQLEARDVPAIFVETSASKRLAEALAHEGAEVDIVELHSESLGEPGSGAATYIEMMRTNARRIADALRPSR